MGNLVEIVELGEDDGPCIASRWLRIVSFGETIYRECRHYIVGSDNSLDLYRTTSGQRLEKFAYFNEVSAVEEVDGPPRTEPEPTSEDTVVKPVSDDDMPF